MLTTAGEVRSARSAKLLGAPWGGAASGPPPLPSLQKGSAGAAFSDSLPLPNRSRARAVPSRQLEVDLEHAGSDQQNADGGGDQERRARPKLAHERSTPLAPGRAARRSFGPGRETLAAGSRFPSEPAAQPPRGTVTWYRPRPRWTTTRARGRPSRSSTARRSAASSSRARPLIASSWSPLLDADRRRAAPRADGRPRGSRPPPAERAGRRGAGPPARGRAPPGRAPSAP